MVPLFEDFRFFIIYSLLFFGFWGFLLFSPWAAKKWLKYEPLVKKLYPWWCMEGLFLRVKALGWWVYLFFFSFVNPLMFVGFMILSIVGLLFYLVFEVYFLKKQENMMWAYIYIVMLYVMAVCGFYELIVVSDSFIAVEHFMHIGPASELYPFGAKNDVLPPNAMMYDIFSYIAKQQFEVVDGQAFANLSRTLYLNLGGITDRHHWHVPGLIKWDNVINELGSNLPTDLTKKQVAFHWIISSELLPLLQSQYESGRYHAGLRDITPVVEHRLLHPSFFGIKNKDLFDILMFRTSVENWRIENSYRPLTSSAYNYLLIFFERFDKDIRTVSSDPILLGGLVYRLPDESALLPPTIERTLDSSGFRVLNNKSDIK